MDKDPIQGRVEILLSFHAAETRITSLLMGHLARLQTSLLPLCTVNLVFCFCLSGFPTPIAIYTLDRKTRARDISPAKNLPGRTYNIRYAPGPYGQPGESTEFFGRRNSYIRFPNDGRLDAKDSITLLAWVLPFGRGPIFEYFRGVRFWVVRSDTLYVHFIRRNGRRTRVLMKRRLKPRRWNYVGATYDERSGVATLWVNSNPVATRRLGRVRLSTKYPIRLGAIRRSRSYFRGKLFCLQLYSVPLTKKQIFEAKRKCFLPGTFARFYTKQSVAICTKKAQLESDNLLCHHKVHLSACSFKL